MRCNRFRADGSACTHDTANADGWCRQDGCPGFVRPDPAKSPTSAGGPHGTAKHIRETGGVPVTDVTVEDIPDINLTRSAVDSFRFHHGGDARAADVQLRAMLEDFLLKSARRVSKGGFVRLAREGYVLTISPDGQSITGYSTVHRERTWEQVKAGVKSRLKNSGKARAPSGPLPDKGPTVELPEFHGAFDPAAVHLTARVRGSFAKIAGLSWAPDEELDATIRAACGDFKAGTVSQRADGCFEVDVADRTWLLTPDCRTLVGVKVTPKPDIPSGQPTDDGTSAIGMTAI